MLPLLIRIKSCILRVNNPVWQPMSSIIPNSTISCIGGGIGNSGHQIRVLDNITRTTNTTFGTPLRNRVENIEKKLDKIGRNSNNKYDDGGAIYSNKSNPKDIIAYSGSTMTPRSLLEHGLVTPSNKENFSKKSLFRKRGKYSSKRKNWGQKSTRKGENVFDRLARLGTFSSNMKKKSKARISFVGRGERLQFSEKISKIKHKKSLFKIPPLFREDSSSKQNTGGRLQKNLIQKAGFKIPKQLFLKKSVSSQSAVIPKERKNAVNLVRKMKKQQKMGHCTMIELRKSENNEIYKFKCFKDSELGIGKEVSVMIEPQAIDNDVESEEEEVKNAWNGMYCKMIEVLLQSFERHRGMNE